MVSAAISCFRSSLADCSEIRRTTVKALDGWKLFNVGGAEVKVKTSLMELGLEEYHVPTVSHDLPVEGCTTSTGRCRHKSSKALELIWKLLVSIKSFFFL